MVTEFIRHVFRQTPAGECKGAAQLLTNGMAAAVEVALRGARFRTRYLSNSTTVARAN